MSWTIRQQKQSNRTLPHSSVASSSSNLAITALTLLNRLSKHLNLKIDSSTPSTPPTWTFPSNFGTSLHLRCKTPLTSFDALKLTQPNWRTNYSRGRTTGIETPWHLLVPMQSFMKMPTQGHCGHLTAWMHGSLGHQKITIAATYTTYLKQKVTTFPAPPTCSHNTVLPQHSLLSHTCRNCQQNSKRPWPQWDAKNVHLPY
jgi:hypothetical protein